MCCSTCTHVSQAPILACIVVARVSRRAGHIPFVATPLHRTMAYARPTSIWKVIKETYHDIRDRSRKGRWNKLKLLKLEQPSMFNCILYHWPDVATGPTPPDVIKLRDAKRNWKIRPYGHNKCIKACFGMPCDHARIS